MLHQGLASASSVASQTTSARQALLTSFSHLTRATRHAAQTILSHPLAKPIVPHLPPPVRSLAHAQGLLSGVGQGEEGWATSWVEKGGVGEFESARVYLAKWARVVAEEGERARQSEAFSGAGSAGASGAAPARDEESSDLGVFELLAVSTCLPFLDDEGRS